MLLEQRDAGPSVWEVGEMAMAEGQRSTAHNDAFSRGRKRHVPLSCPQTGLQQGHQPAVFGRGSKYKDASGDDVRVKCAPFQRCSQMHAACQLDCVVRADSTCIWRQRWAGPSFPNFDALYVITLQSPKHCSTTWQRPRCSASDARLATLHMQGPTLQATGLPA